jgi:hypothetical protein
MAELVRDAGGADPDDLVLEVRRVEDARTVTQRLHVRADAWRDFLDVSSSAGVDEAYGSRRDFWDWLAEAYADTPADTPSDRSEGGTRLVDLAWLREKHEEWQRRS